MLEWAAAVAFIIAAFLFHGMLVALPVTGVILVYMAHCYEDVQLPKIKVRRPVPRKKRNRLRQDALAVNLGTGPAFNTFNCAVCGESYLQSDNHKCKP